MGRDCSPTWKWRSPSGNCFVLSISGGQVLNSKQRRQCGHIFAMRIGRLCKYSCHGYAQSIDFEVSSCGRFSRVQ